jgi:dihydroorotase
LFSVINTYSDLSLELIVEKITTNPRKLFGLESIKIEVGKVANLTVFDSEQVFNFAENAINSTSKNSPFIGKELKGKAVAIFNNGQFKKIVK